MKKLSTLFIILTIFIVSCATTQKKTKEEKNLELLQQNVETTDIHLQKAKKLLINSKFNQALKELNQSKDKKVFYFKGIAYFNLNNNKKAEENFKKSITINQKKEDSLFNLLLIKQTENKLDQALSYAKQILATNPNHSGALYFLGAYYYSQNDLKKALDYFKKSEKFAKNNTAPFDGAFQIYIETGKFQQAWKLKNKIDLTNETNLFNLLIAGEKIQKYKESLSLLNKINQKLSTKILKQKIILLFKSGKKQKALEIAKTIYKQKPILLTKEKEYIIIYSNQKTLLQCLNNKETFLIQHIEIKENYVNYCKK